jgi:hypothetical protein
MPHGIDQQGCEGSCRLRVQYTVNEYSGILLFKIIITEAQVDTKSTTTLMWQLSAGLPDMMAECGSNVKTFNQEYVASKETDRRVKMLRQFSPVVAYSDATRRTEFSATWSSSKMLTPMGPSSLTLRSSCPRPRTSTLNSLRSTNSPAGKKKEDDSLVVLQSSKSSKHSTKFQNGEETPRRKEVAQVVTLIQPSGPVSHPGRGTAVQDDWRKRIITGASETMLTSQVGSS